MQKIVDFKSFGENLWKIADVFRDDTLKTTEYLEEFSYFFFLKLWDDREQSLEEEVGESYIPYLPKEYRFYSWAENPDQYTKSQNCDSIVSFVNKLFDHLAHIGDVVRLKNGELKRLPPEKPAVTDGAIPSDRIQKIERNLELFRKLFRNHTLRVRYDPTIRELCKRLIDLKIEEATEGKWDILGRAYEFIVQKLGEQKQYGQYFTPRHIVDYMIKAIDPEPGETIYDPAAGTCGFLVRAFEYVGEKIKARQRDYARREQMLRELKEKHLFGVEKAPDVFKLGLMNMILHGDGSTHMEEDDSLSSRAQDIHKAKYNIILANPPFGPTAQERTAQFEHHIKLYEALFAQHFMNSLTPGGRAAVVIKEGLLFDSKRVLRAICKKWVEQFQILAILSLPNGVFNPYSGAKTSIIIFRKPLKKDEPRTERVWFYELKSDGRDLGATRRLIDDHDGDLPDFLDKFPYRFDRGRAVLKSSDISKFESEHSWWATIEEIRKNDYNLTANRYCPHRAKAAEHESPQILINRLLEVGDELKADLEELLEMISTKRQAVDIKELPQGWRWIILADIADVKGGNAAPQNKSFYENGTVPFVRMQDIGRYHHTNCLKETSDKLKMEVVKKLGLNLYPPGAILFPRSGSVYLNHRAILGIEACVVSHIGIILPASNRILPSYLYYFLCTFDMSPWATKTTRLDSISFEAVKQFKIPVPPLYVQKQIVLILEKADNLRQIIPTANDLLKSLLSLAFTGELTASWEAEHTEEIATQVAVLERLPRLTLLAFIRRAQQQMRQRTILVTALMKYAFLFQMERRLRQPIYNFVPYKFGPFAKEVYSDLNTLQDEGLLSVKKEVRIASRKDVAEELATYRPARDEYYIEISIPYGKDKEVDTAIKELDEQILGDIDSIINKYGHLDHDALLDVVYERYPKFARRSQRRRKK